MEYSCRFIPARSAMDVDISNYNISKENANPNCEEAYKNELEGSLFEGKLRSKVLAFKNKAPLPREFINPNTVLYSTSSAKAAVKKTRHIAANPEKILDAPGLTDDFYLNLLDWGSNDVLAIGLANTAYLWNASSGSIVELFQTDAANTLTSVQWTKEGRHLAVGLNDGTVQLWDAEACKSLRTLRGHSARVGALSWSVDNTLSSGSRDTTVHNHDVRVANHLVSSLECHTQEVCGLKWSDDGLQLASSGNDNVVNIFDVNTTSPKFSFTEHTACVKALAWAPFQRDLLASGGGTADRTIKFWNTSSGQCVNSIDTGSQVSALQWSKNPACKEIVSSHGFANNQLSVWRYPSLVKVADLKGHEQRVLHMAQSPDGKTIVSGAADETLRFWRIFDMEPSAKATTKPAAVSGKALSSKLIR